MRDAWQKQLRDHLHRICTDTEDVVADADSSVTAADGKLIFLDRAGFLSDAAEKVVIVCEPFLDDLLLQGPLASLWPTMTVGRQIVLSDDAWREAVLLPFESPSKLFLPPARIGGEERKAINAILLVDHIGRPHEIEGLLSLILHGGFSASVADKDDDAALRAPAIHLHVGGHTRFSYPLRILDSWASHRLVVQVHAHGATPHEEIIMVEDGVNGFLVNDVSDLLPTLRRIVNDETLFDLTIARAYAQAQGLQSAWDDAMRRALA